VIVVVVVVVRGHHRDLSWQRWRPGIKWRASKVGSRGSSSSSSGTSEVQMI